MRAAHRFVSQLDWRVELHNAEPFLLTANGGPELEALSDAAPSAYRERAQAAVVGAVKARLAGCSKRMFLLLSSSSLSEPLRTVRALSHSRSLALHQVKCAIEGGGYKSVLQLAQGAPLSEVTLGPYRGHLGNQESTDRTPADIDKLLEDIVRSQGTLALLDPLCFDWGNEPRPDRRTLEKGVKYAKAMSWRIRIKDRAKLTLELVDTDGSRRLTTHVAGQHKGSPVELARTAGFRAIDHIVRTADRSMVEMLVPELRSTEVPYLTDLELGIGNDRRVSKAHHPCARMSNEDLENRLRVKLQRTLVSAVELRGMQGLQDCANGRLG